MTHDRFDHIFIQPEDFEKSLHFYANILGWKIQFQWGEKGQPRGAGLSSGAMSVVMAEAHPADDHSKSHGINGINGTRPTIHLRVDDLDQRYAELSKSGAALFAPEKTHWGTRWFVARDPDGNLFAFEEAL